MFSDLGLLPSEVQNERGEDAEFLDTVWSLKVQRGCVLERRIGIAAQRGNHQIAGDAVKGADPPPELRVIGGGCTQNLGR